MGLKSTFNGLGFPWRKRALEKLVLADDGAGIAAFCAAHPGAARWKGYPAGSDEDYPGPEYYFFQAIEARNYKAAVALLDAGMPLRSLSRYQAVPLCAALRIRGRDAGEAAQEDLDFAEILVQRGASPVSVNGQQVPLLGEAIGNKRVAAVKFLLDHGADAASAMFRLMFFSEKEDAPYQREVLPLLLAKGADPNVRNIWGRTPLFGVHDIETAQILLDHGADPAFNAGDVDVLQPWNMAKDPALKVFLKDAVEQQDHRRNMKDPKHAAAFAKKMEQAVHEGVAVRPAKKIVLKKPAPENSP